MTATTASPAAQMQALVAAQLACNAWPRERLLAHQHERLSRLLAHAVARSPRRAVPTTRARSGVPGSIGRIGAVRSSAWIWDFSSTHSPTARSGGL